jgi:hypothetical protein
VEQNRECRPTTIARLPCSAFLFLGGAEESMNKKLKLKIIERYDSQSNFSIAVGEREPTVSRVIHERERLDKERQQKWANSLGVQPEEIFEGAQP